MGSQPVDEVIRAIRVADTSTAFEILLALPDEGLDEVGEQGRTLLMFLAAHGSLEAVNVLVSREVSVHTAGLQGITALHEAATFGRTAIVACLLATGADVDARDNHSITPLMCAAAWGHLETVQVLLGHGADIWATDDRGGTAADIAGEKGEDAVAAYLNGLAL